MLATTHQEYRPRTWDGTGGCSKLRRGANYTRAISTFWLIIRFRNEGAPKPPPPPETHFLGDKWLEAVGVATGFGSPKGLTQNR